MRAKLPKITKEENEMLEQVPLNPTGESIPVDCKVINNCVIWEGREYYRIKKFDCHIVDLQFTKEGGGYFTVLPISPLEYRRENSTQAKVIINKEETVTQFIIYDDWGTPHEMVIPNYFAQDIFNAEQAAKEQELLKD